MPFSNRGPVASIIISKKRRRITQAFRGAKSNSSESAKSLEEVGLSKSLLFDLQRLRGVFVEVGEERFHLDEARESEVATFRRVLIVSVIVAAALLFLAIRYLSD